MSGCNLIDRDSELDIGSGRFAGLGTRKEGCIGSSMIASINLHWRVLCRASVR